MHSEKITVLKMPAKKVARELAKYFRRSGHVRYRNEERRLNEGYFCYKKGDELRLGTQSAEDLAVIRQLLELGGFKPGRAFRKKGRFCQPVYGRDAVRRFLALVETQGDVEGRQRTADKSH